MAIDDCFTHEDIKAAMDKLEKTMKYHEDRTDDLGHQMYIGALFAYRFMEREFGEIGNYETSSQYELNFDDYD